jgi:hypothetical protein
MELLLPDSEKLIIPKWLALSDLTLVEMGTIIYLAGIMGSPQATYNNPQELMLVLKELANRGMIQVIMDEKSEGISITIVWDAIYATVPEKFKKKTIIPG